MGSSLNQVRVPYSIGDLKREPNLENYPLLEAAPLSSS